MNKVYAFLFMAILSGIAFLSSLLTYYLVGGELFLAGIFVLSALLVISIFLFLGVILLWPEQRQKREKRIWDIPLMPFPANLEKPAKEWKVSTYNVEQPEVEPVFDSLGPSPEISDEDFVELDELDKLVQTQMAPAKKIRKGNGRKKRK